jgi:hypothetical protein
VAVIWAFQRDLFLRGFCAGKSLAQFEHFLGQSDDLVVKGLILRIGRVDYANRKFSGS